VTDTLRILLIEDEARIADLLVRGLQEEGHSVRVAGTLAQARKALAEPVPFDVMVVDRMLPDGDGLQLVRTRRAGGDTTPILVLTARDNVKDRVDGLHGGADDYLAKPFDFSELLARIGAICRRSRPAEVMQCGDLIVDTMSLRVHRNGIEIRLTAQEYRFLAYLMENRGRVVSRTKILEAVWQTSNDPGTNVVEVYMSYLRTKIDRGHERKLLHTVRGLGYLLEDGH
jgi:DNA-binding response OmpR family regulator